MLVRLLRVILFYFTKTIYAAQLVITRDEKLDNFNITAIWRQKSVIMINLSQFWLSKIEKVLYKVLSMKYFYTSCRIF